MIKLILKISPLVLLLVLQGCSKEYCCNIPGTDAAPGTDGYCDGAEGNDYIACELYGGVWIDAVAPIDAVVGSNECYSDQEECEAACSDLANDYVNEGGQCQEGKE